MQMLQKSAALAVVSWLFVYFLLARDFWLPFLRLDFKDHTLTVYDLHNYTKEVITGTIGRGMKFDYPPSYCVDEDKTTLCLEWYEYARLRIHFERQKTKKSQHYCYHITWEALAPNVKPHDCINLGESYWYGGAATHNQKWDISKETYHMQEFRSDDIVEKPGVYGSPLERYWLSSYGVGIKVADDVPLHHSMGNNELCLKADYDNSAFKNPTGAYPSLKYTLCKGFNPKYTHKFMSKRFFPKPEGVPDERMFKSPVWSTWAQFKMNINQSVILKFASDIKKHGFSNSQLEIDDMYTPNYGDFVFDKSKFPDPKAMTTELHNMGFRVTSWVVPFANLNSAAFHEGMEKGYWVQDSGGRLPGLVKWWQGVGAILDVTNEEAVEWWSKRVSHLQDQGIDSFKFDAGETTYLPSNFQTKSPLNNPNSYTTRYAEVVSRFGGMIEVRCGYQSQHLPIFVRMMDKLSTWDYDLGLKSIIPSALLMGIQGYPFILPDMIGGNAYKEPGSAGVGMEGFAYGALPDKELYIRWLQLSAFLPAMQFSIAPWQYDEETIEIARNMVKIHEEFVFPHILKLAHKSVKSGEPIIRPVWWTDPVNQYTYDIDSEFLIGDNILVAPILERGARTRDIYLPSGEWVDKSNGYLHVGGRRMYNHKVPLNKIAYFERSTKTYSRRPPVRP